MATPLDTEPVVIIGDWAYAKGPNDEIWTAKVGRTALAMNLSTPLKINPSASPSREMARLCLIREALNLAETSVL